MAKVDRSRYRFSVTVHTSRREVVYALRGLSMAAQSSGNNKLPWSGQTDAAWREHGRTATFRFTDPDYRTQFLEWARDLLNDTWDERGQSDTDTLPDAED